MRGEGEREGWEIMGEGWGWGISVEKIRVFLTSTSLQ